METAGQGGIRGISGQGGQGGGIMVDKAGDRRERGGYGRY